MKTEHELKVTPYINADHKPEGHYFFAEDALAVLLANDIVFLNAYWWEDSWPEECRRLPGASFWAYYGWVDKFRLYPLVGGKVESCHHLKANLQIYRIFPLL